MSIYQIVNEKTRTLPFFINSIGNDVFQKPCVRKNEFDYHHLITVVSGKGIVECEGYKEIVTKGDVFFIGKNISHAYYSVGKDFSTRWVTFDGTAVDAVLKAYEVNKFKLIKDVNLEKLNNDFDVLYDKIDSKFNDQDISVFLYWYITTFFNCKKTSKTSKAIENATIYMKENFESLVSLEEIADVCGMNKFTFCREFKKIYSISPFEYFLQVRIQHAKKLLTDSDMKINEISIKSGFNDVGYFCRTFKKKEGITPTQFRSFIKKDG